MNTLSIIIPVYKILNKFYFESFEQLVESISIAFKNINHSLQNIIIVNDYPKENISERVRELFYKYSLSELLIILSNEQNEGQAYSRNYGASLAKSEYLHFIDQDDFISQNFYQLLDYDKDILIGNINLFYQKNGVKREYNKKLLKRIYLKSQKITDLKCLLLSNITFSPGQYLIRRKTFDEVEGFPSLKNRGADDYGIFVKLLDRKQTTIHYDKNVIFYYRIHINQSKKILNMHKSLQEFMSQYNSSNWYVQLLMKMKLSSLLKPLRIILNRILLFYKVE